MRVSPQPQKDPASIVVSRDHLVTALRREAVRGTRLQRGVAGRGHGVLAPYS